MADAMNEEWKMKNEKGDERFQVEGLRSEGLKRWNGCECEIMIA
jgi:hypothetical protein